ncbi:MAG: SDR family oxidoreductase [Dehalococcoidia bacterium]|nr:SDR family oxidoreductase [Dehalococcoidia bacterium]
MELTGRVALVTGSTGRGIGRSIALTLAREGADLVLNYETRPERAEAVRQAIEGMGRRVVLQQADVGTEAGARSLYEAAVAGLGRVDILVVSAGGAWQPADTVDLEPERWQRVLAEEVHAPLYLIPPALRGMRERGWGRIILVAGEGTDDWPADAPLDYGLGKASRVWLTRALAKREMGHGVTVNAIAPRTTPYVELSEAVVDVSKGEGWRDRTGARPQDAGEIAAWLCSEAARMVTGTVVEVGG